MASLESVNCGLMISIIDSHSRVPFISAHFYAEAFTLAWQQRAIAFCKAYLQCFTGWRKLLNLFKLLMFIGPHLYYHISEDIPLHCHPGSQNKTK
ncbi:hypothetical protein L484_027289 [Morus notabilis]|uniref:Uncharacterized protein n=1 Tax=Morus notabilis TaxID=981085 RepID=W9QJQ9_9ROSA|nr:hypothetical protein L484_027289 [Morus notabilis]